MKNNARNESQRKKRILAGIVDYSILIVTTIFINSCSPGNIFWGRIEFDIMFFVDILYIIAYMVFKDLLFRNASLGKKIFGLIIVDSKTQSSPKVSVILLRNVMEIIPVLFWKDLLLVISGQTKIIDKELQTDVVLKTK